MGDEINELDFQRKQFKLKIEFGGCIEAVFYSYNNEPRDGKKI